MSSDSINQSARTLGATLRSRRMARGLSLRDLAKEVGLAGHGTLVDYEYGRRIPPEDLVLACERVLGLDQGELAKLRLAALGERADSRAAVLLQPAVEAASAVSPPSPVALPPTERLVQADGPGTDGHRGNRGRALTALVLALLVAVVGLLAARRPGEPATGAASGTASGRQVPGERVRFGFESPADRWVVLWGQRKGAGEVTDAVHYQGRHSYQVTITGASQSSGYVAFGTTHGLQSLHSGMRVTMHLWTSYPRDGVRFFVYGPGSKVVWAPQTPTDGSEVPISGGPQWSTLTWTVPPVAEVQAIGVQPYAENDQPRVVAVDAVSW